MSTRMYLNRPVRLVLALAVGLAAISPMPLNAQGFYGSIVGTVTDKSGANVVGASVTITDKATDEKHTATTGGAGEYQFVELEPAIYTVQIEGGGFKRYLRDTVTVEVNTTTRVDARLEVGEVSQTVEISTEAALLQTDSGTVSTLVQGKQIEEMPLNGRNVMNLLELVPGVIPNSPLEQQTGLNNAGGTNPTAWNGFTTNGGDNTEYMDGAPLNVLNGDALTLVPTQDATQEFSVDTNANGADSGRATGGVINMSSKTGTNRYHGSFYEYFRNADLNANTYAGNLNHQGRPQWNQNQYGLNIGMPIKKDKMFFFGSWEALKIGQSVLTNTNVPTADMQAGIFTRQITDPNAPGDGCVITPSPAGGLRSVATWSLGPGCLNPTTQIMKTYWPACIECSSTTANYYITSPVKEAQNQMNIRYDYNISSKQRMFVHEIWWHIQDSPQIPFPTETHWKFGEQYGSFNNNTAILGDTYTVNPKSVLDVRATYLRFLMYSVSNPSNVDESQFGPAYAALEPYEAFKVLPFPQGLAGYDSLYNFPGGIGQGNAHWDTYGINGSLTRVMGRHSLKIGGEARLMDSENGGVNSAGNLTYGVNFSGSQSKGTGDEFADFLMGYPSSGTFSASVATSLFNYYQGYYVQDTWQAARNLTLNLGLRYELPGGEAEKGNSYVVLAPTTVDPYTGVTGTEVLVDSPQYNARTFTKVRHDLFNPRIGFAYRLDSKTVVRGGYGITNEAVDLDTAVTNNHLNTVNNSISATLTNATGTAPTTFANNPFPSGVTPATRRSSPAFMSTLLTNNPKGYAPTGVYPYNPFPYIQQWNVALARTIGSSFQTSVTYVGTHALHLLAGGNIDEIPASAYTVTTTGGVDSAVAATGPYAGQSLTAKVPGNYCTPGGQCLTGWLIGQTLRPYPYYSNFTNSNLTYGNSHYNALQVQSQMRLRGGGEIGGAFTWAKTIGDNFGTAQQDYNNHRADRSVGGVPMRLAINFVYPLPIGEGQRFLNVGGVVGKIISGFAFNDITSFQHGSYLTITSNTANLLNKDFGGGTTRPNVVPGCSKVVSGSAVSRLNGWFNTSCFAYAGDYHFGNENANDPNLFGQGQDNWDLAMLKTTKITERTNFQFRLETFNTFNRVQFSNPNVAQGNANFGKVVGSSQQNNPRLVQLSARVSF